MAPFHACSEYLAEVSTFVHDASGIVEGVNLILRLGLLEHGRFLLRLACLVDGFFVSSRRRSVLTVLYIVSGHLH